MKQIGTIARFAAATALTTIFSAAALSQADDQNKLDPNTVAETAARAEGFAPKGWKVEEAVKGDLNQDGKIDLAIELIQDIPSTEDDRAERSRALVVAFKTDDGYRRAAVNNSLLQCSTCGGAFYGVLDAPANVSIQKGVLTISQEHGSREVTETTYKFRYDEQPSMFIMIGFDYIGRDRATGNSYIESTNYLTGKRITTLGKGTRTTKKTTVIRKDRIDLESVSNDELEGAAMKRLGLD